MGHKAITIDEVSPEVVVTSSAIPETNPEVIRARELRIPAWPRAKMISALSEDATTVAVAGTHGKTTTSSMVATMLDHLGMDPSFLIGGIVEEYGTNGRNGNGGYFVCEADESDGSFLYLNPDIVVVTNIEADHLTTTAPSRTSSAPSASSWTRGRCRDHRDLWRQPLVRRASCAPRAAGSSPTALTRATTSVCLLRTTTTVWRATSWFAPPKGEVPVTIHANPGRHNMANATAAIAVAYAPWVTNAAARAVSGHQGRPSQVYVTWRYRWRDCRDDYGHHPTEIKATLGAAKDLWV